MVTVEIGGGGEAGAFEWWGGGLGWGYRHFGRGTRQLCVQTNSDIRPAKNAKINAVT